MFKSHRVYIWLLALFLISGCATSSLLVIDKEYFGRRWSSGPKMASLAGVRLDWYIINRALNNSDLISASIFCIDMPFSLCLDLLLLPMAILDDVFYPEEK